jgi:glycosyltransferase involved in cell wall biosynthesis
VKIVMLHYRLRPGGVTTVIRNAQRALAGRHEVEILAEFGYDDRPARSRSAFLAEARFLLEKLPQTGRLHTHNISLGKNPRLTCAVKMLAEQGRVRVLNQIHDFPEENRPAQLRALRYCTGRRDDQFYRQLCYYDLPNVRWATLTSTDAEKLAARGIPHGKIRVLPNPVDDEFFIQPCRRDARPVIAAYAREHGYRFDPRQPFLLSPMKVMERKNNAEAVALIAQLPGWQLVISLDATSPRDRVYSDRLKRRIRREKLPVVIGVGQVFENPLPLFHTAHAILTTSKQEGFGYAFLEGWLSGKMVVGRDIPEVTQDFIAAGMDLTHLYRRPDPAILEDLLAKPSRRLIAHNRQVVLRQYSLAAYARRYAGLWPRE